MKYLFILIISFIFLYGYCIFPRLSKKKELKEFEKYYYAHRGLHNEQYPENSLPAFENAKNHGYGIELDVHVTKDDELVICHDFNIQRVCGVDLEISETSYEELKKYKLFNSDYGLPRLKDVFDCIDHKIPLIIEIKQKGMNVHVCEKTAELLDQYKSNFVVESFNPLAMNWFLKHRPHYIRGQLSMDFSDDDSLSTILKFGLKHLCLNFLSRPDFIAYHIKDLNEFSFRLLSKFTKTVIWTCKDENTFHDMKNKYNLIIFENFKPKS